MSGTEKVFDTVYNAADLQSSPVTISGLQGDTYDYTLVFFMNGGVTNNSELALRLNGDSGTNYDAFGYRGQNASVIGETNTSKNRIEVGQQSILPQDNWGMSITNIKGTVATGRTAEVFGGGTDSVNSIVYRTINNWDNAIDELTSIEISALTASAPGDYHIVLYRSHKALSMGAWELLEDIQFSSRDFSTDPLEFENLEGDNDIEYLIQYDGDDAFGAPYMLKFNAAPSVGIKGVYTQGKSSPAAFTASGSGTFINLRSTTSHTINIHAETGQNRIIRAKTKNTAHMEDAMYVWEDSLAEITKITFEGNPGGSVNGRARLYRRNTRIGVPSPLPFKLIAEEVLDGVDLPSFTFKDLSFDGLIGTPLLYRIDIIGKKTLASASELSVYCGFNEEGFTYNSQKFLIEGTTFSAQRNLPTSNCTITDKLYEETVATAYIYAGPLNNRFVLSEAYGLSDDPVAPQSIQFSAGWWDDSDPITSIEVGGDGLTDDVDLTIRISRVE